MAHGDTRRVEVSATRSLGLGLRSRQEPGMSRWTWLPLIFDLLKTHEPLNIPFQCHVRLRPRRPPTLSEHPESWNVMFWATRRKRKLDLLLLSGSLRYTTQCRAAGRAAHHEIARDAAVWAA